MLKLHQDTGRLPGTLTEHKGPAGMAKSAKSGGRTVQQVPLPAEIHGALRLLANDRDTTLNAIYDEAIQWFLRSRAKKSFRYYIASNRRSKYTTLWIDTMVVGKVRIAAKRDAVAMNRVIYTALVLYLESKNLI